MYRQTHTANGSPRCCQFIEPPSGTGSCPQCSRTASHVPTSNPDSAVQVCGQHARSYDRLMADDERLARTRRPGTVR